MRSQRVVVGVNMLNFLQPGERDLLMFRNEDAALIIKFQCGDSPGDIGDFFDIRPGEVFTFDPRSEAQAKQIRGAWWFCSPGGNANLKLLVG